ncbi:MAG: hypothetical protein KKA73_03850 [Chloroflexi bacterium]|nr:hypothetical protein [Chloroflexota bacterium]MBU1746798.1 hypothetical protein [Chloroflexota bacterium]
MNRIWRLNPIVTFAAFVLLDVFCVGAGMGVPFFCILLGFPVGWFGARRAIALAGDVHGVLGKALAYAVVTSAVTFAFMALIWGTFGTALLDPTTDYVNLGTPLILYEPQVSFIGWLGLMIVVSPFLQLLLAVFGSYLTVLYWLHRNRV